MVAFGCLLDQPVDFCTLVDCVLIGFDAKHMIEFKCFSWSLAVFNNLYFVRVIVDFDSRVRVSLIFFPFKEWPQSNSYFDSRRHSLHFYVCGCVCVFVVDDS